MRKISLWFLYHPPLHKNTLLTDMVLSNKEKPFHLTYRTNLIIKTFSHGTIPKVVLTILLYDGSYKWSRDLSNETHLRSDTKNQWLGSKLHHWHHIWDLERITIISWGLTSLSQQSMQIRSLYFSSSKIPTNIFFRSFIR